VHVEVLSLAIRSVQVIVRMERIQIECFSTIITAVDTPVIRQEQPKVDVSSQS
jgi:hypothetical protein